MHVHLWITCLVTLLSGGAFAQFGPEQVIIEKDLPIAYGSALCDIDGDGRLDAVVSECCAGQRIGWYRNLGDGEFGTMALITADLEGPGRCVTALIDNDQQPDIVCAPEGENSFFWLENNTLSAWPEHPIGSYSSNLMPLAWTVGDVDTDGDNDLLFQKGDPGSDGEAILIGYHLNDGLGTFQAEDTIEIRVPLASTYLWHASVADLDLDGINDLFVINDSLSWYPGLGAGAFAPRQVIPLAIDYDDLQACTVDDADGNGTIDLLVGYGYDGTPFSVYGNSGGAEFSLIGAVDFTPANELVDIALADMDGDGDKDILLRYDGNNTPENGNRAIWLPVEVTPSYSINANAIHSMSPQHAGWSSSSWGDIDQNGITDVLLVSTPGLVWCQQSETLEPTAHFFGNDPNGGICGIADMDADGLMDIATGPGWLSGMGAGEFADQYWLFDEFQGGIGGVGDLDSDGDVDILKFRWILNSFAEVLLKNDTGGYSPSTALLVFSNDNGPGRPQVLDMDEDGDRDILMAMQTLEVKVAWFENLGNGIFQDTAHTIWDYDNTGVWYSYREWPGDLDGDGDEDLVAFMTLDGIYKFVYSLNDGAGSFSDPEEIGAPWDVKNYGDLGDVDGDGDLDLVWANNAPELIHWARNDGSGNFTDHQTFSSPNPRTLELLDINEDGLLELVSVGTLGAGAHLYGLGADSLFHLLADIVEPLFADNTNFDNVSALDVNEDGHVDLLLGRLGFERISYLQGVDCSTFAATIWWAGTDLLQATEGIAYQWFLNGDSIAGATSQFIVTDQPGNYSASVRNDHGCIDITDIYPVIALTNPAQERTSYRIFPNPSSSEFHLIGVMVIDQQVQIEIMDMHGRVVRKMIGNGSRELIIERGDLSSGAYTVRLIAAHERVGVVRLIVE